ncbi:GNAT family N-acetyltransferase [Bordetella genomosp. 8]|uniref:GNAT family N-acetyltransferase n=1 Tax=Bordetella genomosp. 8 TaxID=1416806 RepID=UPI001E61A8A7|nr:GNAT family N-acetyltransferase [Bordetella genomosp. 8]
MCAVAAIPSTDPVDTIDALALRIEEAALNATVVREQMLYDGWLVRWAPSVAKRARSINVIATPHRDLEEKLAYCRELYGRARQPLIFRLTSASPDRGLDEQLAARGWHRYAENAVMVASMRGTPDPAMRGTLRYEQADADGFATIAGMLRRSGAEHVTEHRRRLSTVAVPCVRLVARDDEGRTVATGMAVIDGELAGIFDVVVDEESRRRGYARQIMHRLFDVARDAGAARAYLQVEQGNAAARRLYASLGFSDRYTYWYRTHQHE